MSLKSMLNSSMDIYGVADAQDALGGNDETESATQTGVACRLRNMNGKEQELLGRLGVVASSVIYCNYNDLSSEITEGDIIKMDSQTFDVRYVDNWNNDNKYFKCYVEERK